MNSTKLLIGIAVVFLVDRTAPAQSLLEDLVLEADIASSVLQIQANPNDSGADTPSRQNSSVANNNTVVTQAPIPPKAAPVAQLKIVSQFNGNESTWKDSSEMSFADVPAVQEPHSQLHFGIGRHARKANHQPDKRLGQVQPANHDDPKLLKKLAQPNQPQSGQWQSQEQP